MNYSQMVKELRMRMILTQQEFADHLGVSFETINRWENGKNEPTMKCRRTLAILFKEYKVVETKEENKDD